MFITKYIDRILKDNFNVYIHCYVNPVADYKTGNLAADGFFTLYWQYFKSIANIL